VTVALMDSPNAVASKLSGVVFPAFPVATGEEGGGCHRLVFSAPIGMPIRRKVT
jgi:hypothetical protein